MASSSLDTNPPNADRNITAGGSDWLWVAFAIMLFSNMIMIFWSFTRPLGTRLFHQIAIAILTTASISYFSMASDLGSTPVTQEFSRGHGGTRQIWFVRYIQWFITLPLLLLELTLVSGLALSDQLTTLFMAWVLVVSGLVGALVPTSFKWGYFAFALLALFYIWYTLLYHVPRTPSAALPPSARLASVRAGAALSLLLLLYPLCWALAEGGAVITPDGEMVWYGALDVLAGPALLFALLWARRERGAPRAHGPGEGDPATGDPAGYAQGAGPKGVAPATNGV